MMASDFEDLPNSTSDSSFASAGIQQEQEGTAKKNASGAACSNDGASSCRDIHVEARTLLEDSAARIEEDWQWYETLGLSWGRVLNEDKGNGDDPAVGAVLAFNVKMGRIAPAHERALTPALEALKEVLVAVHNVSNAMRDHVLELVEYCVGVTRGALEAARREEMPQAIAQALENITAEIEWVEKFTRTYRTVRTGCCRRATLSECDHRRAVAHRKKLQDLLILVLAALAAQSNVDHKKLVRMLSDSAGVGDESGSGLESGSENPPNGAAEAKELADVPREAPVLSQMYVKSLAAVERVVLDLIDPARGALSAHCLVGPEGSGKTLLASEVVRDRRVRSSFRDGIFWFTAGRDGKAADAALFLERVARDLAGAASRGTMSTGPHHPQPHRLRYCRLSSSEVGGNLRCLVVLDDARDAKIVRAFASAGFHALVTTRRREVIPRASGGLCSELAKMQRGEAIELLRRASGALKPLREVEAVQVAELCAMLPLALKVAGALARDDPLEATTWQRLREELLEKSIELLESELECVTHVFAVVYAGLCRLSEAQRGQFRLLAVLSPGAIATTDMLANLWDTEVGDVRACADLLVDRGLLQAVPEGYRLDGTVLDYLRRTIQLTVTHADDADCPPPTLSELASARQARYLSRPELLHVQHSPVDLCSLVGLWRAAKRVASLGGEVIVVERCYAESLGVLGVEEELPCWRAAGRVVGLLAEYEGAERMLEKALAISEEREEGEDDLEDVATALKDLGRALESQGQLENANRVYARAIEVGERTLSLSLSAHHGRDRLNSLHYPGHPLDEWSPVPPRDHQGMYEGAVLLYQRAIETGERVLGPDHPDLASRLNNLAELLRDQGKYDEAEPLYERSQAIRERALGPDDPVVATSLNNRAELLRARGEYARAEPLTMRAQAILEKSEGLHHPDVAMTVTNRATLLEAQGKYVDAAPLRLRAIQIWEKIHGPDHELVATALGGQAGVLRHQGKYADAEVLYKRAVKIWTHICGPDHPRVATALNNRAAVLKAQGKYAEADPLYVRSIKIGEATLGAGHPTVATRLGNRARLLAAQGKHDEAVVLLERAVSIRRNALGDYHKGTITFRRALESVRREQISASE